MKERTENEENECFTRAMRSRAFLKHIDKSTASFILYNIHVHVDGHLLFH